jgi:hypothetical protein
MPPKYYRNVRRRSNKQKPAPAGKVRTPPTSLNDGRKRPLEEDKDEDDGEETSRENKKRKVDADAEPEFLEFENPWNSGILPIVPCTRG